MLKGRRDVREHGRRLKLWIARKLWNLSLRMGVAQDQEIEEAIRLVLKEKMTELGPDFERWVRGVYPQQVSRHGEARNLGESRSRRV